MRRHPLAAASLLGTLLLPAPPLPPAEPLVAAHYFYWYRWPAEHFNQEGAPGREGHRHHLPRPELASYLSPAWHEEQFRAMAWAGIDVALPVYWGAPGAYDRPGLSFSRAGLPPMVEALQRIRAGGGRGVALGLFYDTTTLLASVRGALPPERPDLTAPAGRELFCRTVIDYFAAIPPELWGRLDGRPLVVLYVSAFAGRWDRELGAALRRAFAARFPGEEPCLVADASWGEIGQDLTCAWGAALAGPRLFPGVAQIGPGYDDSPVPGRNTPIRDREGGGFYRHSWRAALARRPRLVLVETWNELHEGTEICETLETGRLYLEITREWAARLKAGGEPGPEIPLGRAEPRPRPDLSWGQAAAGAALAALEPRPGGERGLRERPWEDGPCRREGGLLRAGAAGRTSYLYLQASDSWRFDLPAPGEELVLRVWTAGPVEFAVEYDSHDRTAILDGAYTRARRSGPAPAGAVRHDFRLPGARLANRQNGGADLRLVLAGGEVAVARLELAPLRRL